jgi:hypothetical protein
MNLSPERVIVSGDKSTLIMRPVFGEYYIIREMGIEKKMVHPSELFGFRWPFSGHLRRFSTTYHVLKSGGNLSFLQLLRLWSKILVVISAKMAGCYNLIAKRAHKAQKKHDFEKIWLDNL